MAVPVIRSRFTPSIASTKRAADAVASTIRKEFINDLLKAKYAQDLAELIEARVQARGTDRFGAKMAKYSLSYKWWRWSWSLQTAFVDLTVTGKFLKGMKGGKHKGEPAVSFVGSHGSLTNALLAKYIIGGTKSKKTGKRLMPPRDFFGLTKPNEAAANSAASILFQWKTLPKLLKRKWEN